ncbi:MAG: mercuric reductase [Elusimicrobiota bacterium]
MTAAPLLIPLDEHNKACLENVHPPDWINPEPAGRYNLVVIGAGTAGLITAIGAAGLGAKVALIERHLMGGDCLNAGCVPSKGLLRAARAAADARRAGEFGVRTGPVEVDFPKVMERMRRLRAGISKNDSARRFTEAGVDVFIGDGKFTAPGEIEVAGKTLRYAKAVIATGARAAAPPIPGINDTGHLTNETVFSLTELPKRLLVVGAGPIGVELSQAFARFGSEVHLLEAAGQILIREDKDAAKIVEQALLRDGVNIISGCAVKKLAHKDGGKVVELDCGNGCREIPFDEVLIAVGRAPNVDGMGLEKIGVEFDSRLGVTVDDTLQTTNPDIYAAGDVCSRYKFTHTADALARIVIQNALFGLPGLKKKASALTIPWCTYSDPEIAHVGIYEKDAAAEGLRVRTFMHGMADVDRAVLDGDTAGFVKVHVEEGTDRILGATVVARHAGDIISELTLAMTAGAGLGVIAGTIHPYPTQAEAVKRVGDAYSRTKLTPVVKSLFGRWLAWSR